MSETKKWRLKTKNGKRLEFYPRFIVDERNNTNCDIVTIKEGENEYILNYLDLLMFVYFIGDEEQRRKVASTQVRAIKEIPFDVTFKIDEKEKKLGVADRRIMLPIDGLIAAYCRDEAKRIVFKRGLKGR